MRRDPNPFQCHLVMVAVLLFGLATALAGCGRLDRKHKASSGIEAVPSLEAKAEYYIAHQGEVADQDGGEGLGALPGGRSPA